MVNTGRATALPVFFEMELSKYLKIYPSTDNPNNVILFSTKNAAIVELPRNMAEELPYVELSPEDKKMLVSDGFLVRSREKEKKELLSYIDDINGLSKILSIKLVMNLDCNLACRYCFEGKRKGRHYLTKETADDFVKFVKGTIKRLSDIKVIVITFYGGEPLLSRNLVISISEELKSFTKEKGLKLRLYLQTNGTLLNKDIVKKLKPLGLKGACVTLDGPAHIHNAFRPFKAGSGSFSVILRNIKEVHKQIGLDFNGNFVKGNYREFPGILDYLNEEGIDITRFASVSFSPVVAEREDFGPAGFHDGCCSINEPWFTKASVWLRDEILKRKGRQVRNEPYLCMAEYKNNLLVNYDGSIYKCPAMIERKEYKVGDIWSGVKDYRESHNLDNWKNDKCLDCSYLPMCFGGCRQMKLVRDGNMNGVDCRRDFFDATLEASVKQDIKYGLTK